MPTMQKSLRPYLTSGVALAGAALVAIVPAVPQPATAAPEPLRVVSAATELTALETTIALPQSVSGLLNLIGPLMTTSDAFNQILADAKTNPIALLEAPFTLLNAFFFGHSGITLGGITLPLFHGLFAGAQNADVSLTVGQLVDAAGVGNTTVTDLVNQLGVGNESVQDLLISLLGSSGSTSVASLVDQLAGGDGTVAGLVTGLLNNAGLGDKTLGDLLDQFGVSSNESVAALLIQVLNESGVGNPSLSSLLDQLGPGNETLASLLGGLLGTPTNPDPTITDLLDQLGVGDQTLGGILKELVGPGDPTVTALLDQLGIGGTTLGTLLPELLGSTGTMTPAALIEQLLGTSFPDAGSNPTLGDLIVDILHQDNIDMTLSQLLASSSLSSETLGALLMTPGADGAAPIGDSSFISLLDSVGAGSKTLGELGHVSSTECFFAPIIGIHCSATLDSLMGPNSIYETLSNLKSAGDTSTGVAAGTPLTDVTIGQLLSATGAGNDTLSQLVTGLNLNTPVDSILNDLGLNSMDLNTLLTTAFPGVAGTTVNTVLGDWGLNNLPIDTAIDNLGLNQTIDSIANDLGWNNLDVSTVLNTLLGTTTLGSIADDLGLNNVDLDTFLTNLLGNVSVGSIVNDVGLNKNDLDTIVTNLLGNTQISTITDDLGLNNVDLTDLVKALGLNNTSVDSVLSNLGVSNLDLNQLLSNLGITDTDVIDIHLTGL